MSSRVMMFEKSQDERQIANMGGEIDSDWGGPVTSQRTAEQIVYTISDFTNLEIDDVCKLRNGFTKHRIRCEEVWTALKSK